MAIYTIDKGHMCQNVININMQQCGREADRVEREVRAEGNLSRDEPRNETEMYRSVFVFRKEGSNQATISTKCIRNDYERWNKPLTKRLAHSDEEGRQEDTVCSAGCDSQCTASSDGNLN